MHLCLLPCLSFYAHLLSSSILLCLFSVLGFLFTFVNGHTCFCFIHACSVLFILFICGVACAPDQHNEMCLFIYLLFSTFFLKTILVMFFGVCRRMFEVIYNGHGLCMFVCYHFLQSTCCLMLFFVCF